MERFRSPCDPPRLVTITLDSYIFLVLRHIRVRFHTFRVLCQIRGSYVKICDSRVLTLIRDGVVQVGNGGMSLTWEKIHFSLWSILAAPLLISTDILVLSDDSLGVLLNAAVIAVSCADASQVLNCAAQVQVSHVTRSIRLLSSVARSVGQSGRPGEPREGAPAAQPGRPTWGHTPDN